MFSTRLKELRKEKNYTQKELAARLNLSSNSICEWEKGRCEPSIDILKQLSLIFNVSVDYIIGVSEDDGFISFNASNEFSSEERQLVEDYRALSPALKEMIQLAIQTWKGAPANANKPRRA